MDDNPLNNLAVFCKDCGHQLNPKVDPFWNGTEPPKPCLNCNSISRHINLSFHEKISEAYDDSSFVATSLKDTGGKKVIYKGKYGTELHHDTKTLQYRERTFDFVKHKYFERIFNKITGFFKEVNESLSEHRGYGSAKNKNKDKQ